METNELKILWKTLAENSIVDKEIARENISRIISQKGTGLIAKMKRQIMFDYIMYLSAFIALPCAILFLNIVLKRPSNTLQIVGVFAIECYLLSMFLKSRGKLKSLESSDHTGSIKDSLINFRSNYLKTIRREKSLALVFGYFIMSLALIQFFVYKGSVLPLNFSRPYDFFPIFLIFGMIFLPSIMKFENKTRYAKNIAGINLVINDLTTEETE